MEFLSCNWGTSSFRLLWISGDVLHPVREFQDETGCRKLFDLAGRQPGAARFESHLRSVLDPWSEAGRELSRPIPLVVSGMASSTIGWRELPYAPVPLKLDGSDLRFARIDWERPGWVGNTYLISGVATRAEIMRGEEVEAIGLFSGLDANSAAGAVLVLPGTHSKHIVVEQGSMTDFRTYMTGELFEVLARHSILKASVERNAAFDPEAFAAGARWGAERGLGAGLFRARTRAVLDHSPAGENAWFLSGLLIGAELRDLLDWAGNRAIYLAGNVRLGSLYQMAMRLLAPKETTWTTLPEERVRFAAAIGQSVFLQRHAS